MSKNKPREVTTPPGSVFQDLGNQIKLIMRLMGDIRVSPILKLLPLGSLIYLIIPDIAPGPIDDAIVLWLGSVLFVELCPPHIVQEHRDALLKTIPGQWVDVNEDDVVEGEMRDLN